MKTAVLLQNQPDFQQFVDGLALGSCRGSMRHSHSVQVPSRDETVSLALVAVPPDTKEQL
ncbi:MAG: hypothetical protein ACYDB4_17800 [Candidatus Dormibacteraceae bacterium]